MKKNFEISVYEIQLNAAQYWIHWELWIATPRSMPHQVCLEPSLPRTQRFSRLRKMPSKRSFKIFPLHWYLTELLSFVKKQNGFLGILSSPLPIVWYKTRRMPQQYLFWAEALLPFFRGAYFLCLSTVNSR